MANVIRATTPTITYQFSVIDVTDISVAYLTITQGGKTIVEKDLTTATVGEDTLSWTFSQAETLAIRAGQAFTMLNWRLADGTRGASKREALIIEDNDKDEVI